MIGSTINTYVYIILPKSLRHTLSFGTTFNHRLKTRVNIKYTMNNNYETSSMDITHFRPSISSELEDMHLKYDHNDHDADKSDEDSIESNKEIISSLDSILTKTTCSDEESISNSTSSIYEDSNYPSERRRSIMKQSNSSSRRSNLKTSFSTLEIREYVITLGDNPGGCQGPPMTLDWGYNKKHTKVVALEDYERRRPPRRCKSGLHVPDNMRMCLLERKNGFSFRQLQKAAKNAELIRMQRRSSGQCSKVHQALSNVVRPFHTLQRRTRANTKINAQYSEDHSK